MQSLVVTVAFCKSEGCLITFCVVLPQMTLFLNHYVISATVLSSLTLGSATPNTVRQCQKQEVVVSDHVKVLII